MVVYILWSAFTWTFKGILCTCRFLWICPYNAIKFLPREQSAAKKTRYHLKPTAGCERRGSVAIPGSPDRATTLHNRLTKTEKEINSLKTRLACERASWEKRFAELQRKQEELHYQLFSETGVCLKVGGYEEQGQSGVDNGELFDESSSGPSRYSYEHRGSDVMSSRSDICPSSLSTSQLSFSSRSGSSTTSMDSSSPGPHRVFVPHSPMDLQLGHRVRIILPSGRISTGTIRFLGHLQGKPDVHMGVELETPGHGQQDGSYRGHSYFECKPGYGTFVPFNKLLMAWE